MNAQSGTAQLRYLEETATRLRQNGFMVEPIEDHHLPVCWEKGRLCRISDRGSVLYRQENVDSVRTQDALQSVIDTAKMTSEYMAILETAPRLKASGLDGDYRVLADFGSAVLAGHPHRTRRAIRDLGVGLRPRGRPSRTLFPGRLRRRQAGLHRPRRACSKRTPFSNRSSLRRSTARWRSSASRTKAFRADGIRS